MAEVLSSRRKFLGAGAAGTLGLLLTPEAVFADDAELELVRWDLITVTQNVVLSGGQDQARDAASGDVVTLTGSGQFAPQEGTAAGGGTIVHRKANGTEVARGVYRVTGFKSFTAAGGSLLGTGLADGIGTLEQTAGGSLLLKVAILPSTGGTLQGLLGVDCHLPGSEIALTEGVTLSVGPFSFKQAGGGTLFHVLQ